MEPSPSTYEGTVPWFGALRSRDFRYYWTGYLVSVSGQQMLWMVQGWLIYELTNSKLLLGVSGLVQVAPAVGLTLLGGVVADKVDQRRLLIGLQFLQVSFLAILAGLCFTDAVEVWHILVFISVRAAAESFERPAYHSMYPHLIERSALTSAVALNATVHPATRILGPALAGIVLTLVMNATSSATLAAGTLFSATALGHAIYSVLLWRVHLSPTRRSRGASVFQEIGAGIQFIWTNRVFTFLIGMAYFSMFFGASATAIFPVFAKDILDTGPSGLGFMFTAMGIGSFSGALLAASMGNPQRWRWMIIGGASILGTFLVVFGLSSWYLVSLLSLAMMGIGNALFGVATQSTLQMLVADEFRGRVMGVWGLTHGGVRPLGEMQYGSMASIFSAPIAVILGGTLVVAFALLVAAPNRRVREIKTTPTRA